MSDQNNGTVISPQNLSQEINIMLDYVIQRGLSLPADTSFSFENTQDVSLLVKQYNDLRTLISPATPDAISYVGSQYSPDSKGIKQLWRVPLFSKCLIFGLITFAVLIATSLLPEVNSENLSKSLLTSSGWQLLVNLIFICSAALLGAIFYQLKTISDKIRSVTLLPVDNLEFFGTMIMGMIAGFLLSEMLSLPAHVVDENIEVNKMSLSLLGGFASDAIFSLLQGLVEKLKSIFNING
ncbi:MAG: hypothetical protein KDC49_14555 [Saprospiraceae bacterium]|nr:hypothetical protein [Saprospiraceae bacterium]